MELRTLVTGGSSFIGTNLVEALRQSGRKVLSIDTRPPRCAEHAASFQSMDVLDCPALLGLFETFGPTAELAGRLPYSLERGVDETLRWLRERGEL